MIAAVAGLALLAGEATAQAPGGPLVAPVVVVGAAPLPGAGVAADKLAGEVQSLSVPGLTKSRRAAALPDLIATQLAGVSLSDELGSPFQPDFSFRGFQASPVSGIAEGLAVYEDGVRLNEAFGDNVNWDLVPLFAIRDVAVQSNNPVFGLNALGGAVTLAMKDGLTTDGARAELSGGSFGDRVGNAEFARRFGDLGLYLAAGAQHDDGFRDRSPATLRQAYGDLAYAQGKLVAHLSLQVARNDIDALGPTPVELLAADPRAVFTSPQSTRNEAETVQLRGTYQAAKTLSLSANLYDRRFVQQIVDGNTTDVVPCANDVAQLCLEGASQFPADALYDSHGSPVGAGVLPPGATPGELDVIRTRAASFGGAAQAALTAPLAGHANVLTLGAALDHGDTRYTARGELGVLHDDLSVTSAGVTIDQGLSPTASPPIEAPVEVVAQNTYAGLYAINVLDLTPSLSLTLSGRWNFARLRLRDQTGGDLSADHRFARFNPGAGLAYRVAPALTAYAGYSEANRAPTAGELSCADPASPCLLGAFLVADPPLKQVTARTVEAGLRGRAAPAGLAGTLAWTVSTFRTVSQDDILLVATPVNGFGYFQNAGATLRRGVDANLTYRQRGFSARLGYSYLEASFRNAQVLTSNSPAANADGLISVRPGDRLPMVPAQRLTVSADDDLTEAWTLGVDLRWQSGQYLVGDESNQEPKLPGFVVVNLHTAYQLAPRVELFGEIRNLFDERFYTYGAFAALDGLPPSVRLTDPRTYSPAAGRAVAVGARVRFD